MSDSLQPREPQHARPPCPSPTSGVHPNPCPLSQWCHPTISSSVVPVRFGKSGIITCTCYQSDIYSVLFTNEAYVSVFIYLSNLCPRWGFVAVPGLVPRCGEWALLSSEMRRLLITPLLWKHSWQEAWTTGSLASGRVGSSQTRDRTCVPCTGGWILSHCTTREVQEWSGLRCVSLLFHVCFLKYLPFISHTLWRSFVNTSWKGSKHLV